MVHLSEMVDNSIQPNENLQSRLLESFQTQKPKVVQFSPLHDAFSKKLAVHPFLIAPSCTFRKFSKYDIAKNTTSLTGSLLQWRMLSVREIVDSVINSMPPASIIDPLLLDELQEPEFYQWLKSLRLNPDRVQRMPSSELLRTLQQYRAHATRQTNQSQKDKAGAKNSLPGATSGALNFKKIHNLDNLREKLRLKLEALQVERNKNQPDGQDDKQTRKEINKLRREESKVLNKKRKLESAISQPSGADQRKADRRGAQQQPEVFNGQPTFNKLKLDAGTSDDGQPRAGKRPHLTGKNFKRLLNAVNVREQKISTVAETNVEQAVQLKQKQAWRDALAKAEGVKVRNDPTIINKAINKQEKRKRAQGKKWEARLEGVKDRQQKQQAKRERNLDKRQDSRNKKKFTKAVKRGHILPGFGNM